MGVAAAAGHSGLLAAWLARHLQCFAFHLSLQGTLQMLAAIAAGLLSQGLAGHLQHCASGCLRRDAAGMGCTCCWLAAVLLTG